MPVRTETTHEGRRHRPRWPWPAPLSLLFLVAVASFIGWTDEYPLEFQLAGTVVAVGGDVWPQGALSDHPGWNSLDWNLSNFHPPCDGPLIPGGTRWVPDGETHHRWFRVGQEVYGVTWLEAHAPDSARDGLALDAVMKWLHRSRVRSSGRSGGGGPETQRSIPGTF